MATHRLNSMEVKKMNRNAIYRYLYHRESTSIQEIAQALNLSLPTVTQNLKELQERELIEETGLFESTGGRKAKSMACNSVARYAIGLDVTLNHVGIVIIDLSGRIVKNVRNHFPFANSEVYFQGWASWWRILWKIVSLSAAGFWAWGLRCPRFCPMTARR